MCLIVTAKDLHKKHIKPIATSNQSYKYLLFKFAGFQGLQMLHNTMGPFVSQRSCQWFPNPPKAKKAIW